MHSNWKRTIIILLWVVASAGLAACEEAPITTVIPSVTPVTETPDRGLSPTLSGLPSASPAQTGTPGPTAPDQTVSPTHTATPVPTITLPPVATATDTPIPTATPTWTLTATPSATTTPSATATVTPTPTFAITDWRGAYYANQSLGGTPVLVRNDRNISFDWDTGAPAPGLPDDSFAVRWTQTMVFDGATYRFFVRVDDGVRLWIDDELVINAWYDSSVHTVSASYPMVRGEHRIRLEYYEYLGEAEVRFWWEKVTDYSDWKGEYWPNRSFRGLPALIRDDEEIDFNWGTDAPAPGLPEDNFTIRWTRQAQFEGLTYRFHAIADDLIRVWVDDVLIIDSWYGYNPGEITIEHTVTRGPHDIRVEYAELGGHAEVELWWEPVTEYTDWQGAYWWNPNLSGQPAMTRNDPALDFDWGEGSPAPAIPNNYFSARWTNQIHLDAGTYRFHVLVDDNVRLWVDDELLIDAWTYHNPNEMTAEVTLDQGVHQIRVEYVEREGQALIELWWERITSYADWKGEYWDNANLTGNPILVRNDSNIDFDWGTGAPATGLPVNDFSARWTRLLTLGAGRYRFHVQADDVVRLWVDDQLLIDTWGNPRLGELTNDISLTQGEHTIRVEYAEYGGNASIHLWWEEVGVYPEWKGQYWDNRDLAGPPTLVRNDPQVDFYWGQGAPSPLLPPDNFSVRWTRTVRFDAGVYRFHLLADDVARLWIDDVLIIDNWYQFNPEPLTADHSLSQGEHRLRVEYAEWGGNASIRLRWERLNYYPDWKGEYYANRNLAGDPVLVRNDNRIDFDWGQGRPAPGVPRDNFGVRWSREISFSAGTYRFHIFADDGVRIFVDGELILDEWHEAVQKQEYLVDYALSGTHQIVVEYYDHLYEAEIVVWWERIAEAPPQPL